MKSFKTYYARNRKRMCASRRGRYVLAEPKPDVKDMYMKEMEDCLLGDSKARAQLMAAFKKQQKIVVKRMSRVLGRTVCKIAAKRLAQRSPAPDPERESLPNPESRPDSNSPPDPESRPDSKSPPPTQRAAPTREPRPTRGTTGSAGAERSSRTGRLERPRKGRQQMERLRKGRQQMERPRKGRPRPRRRGKERPRKGVEVYQRRCKFVR